MNLAEERPEDRARLAEALEAWVRGLPEGEGKIGIASEGNQALDGDTRNALRELGYIE